MASPFAPLLTRIQAPDFELDEANASEVSASFLASVRTLTDFTHPPDTDFEAVFETYTAAVAARRIDRDVAEGFLAEYSMISRSALSDYFARACAKYVKVVRSAQSRVNELKLQVPEDDDEAREDHQLTLAEVERDLQDVSRDLADFEAKSKLADAERKFAPPRPFPATAF